DFNRVEFTDLETGLVYRLKSDAARGIDQWANAPTLFDSMKYIVAPAVMLIHRFTPNGLDLAVAGTKALPGSSRLVVTGDPTPIGSWPYAADFGGALFDQAEEDWFDDLAGDEEEGQDDSE